jgi:hypothetical protein
LKWWLRAIAYLLIPGLCLLLNLWLSLCLLALAIFFLEFAPRILMHWLKVVRSGSGEC